MAAITFMSDFGEQDHYVAAVKAAILKLNPNQQILDITHQVRKHDIGHAAFVLRQLYADFPAGTVHIIAVDPVVKGQTDLIAVRLQDQIMLSHNSGIFALLSDSPPTEQVLLEKSQSKFMAKDILAPTAEKLASGIPLNAVGEPIDDLYRLVNVQARATKREIVGQVMHIDDYGNLITNVKELDFDAILKLHGDTGRYTIRFGHEQFPQLHEAYSSVEGGECFVFFNSSGWLELGQNHGRACDMLGLKIGSPVVIEFNS